MFSVQDWDVFRFCQQDKMSFHRVAEKLGISVKRVRAILKEMHKQEPDLFYSDSEHHRLHDSFSGPERKKFKPRIFSLEVLPDMSIKDVQEQF